MVALRIPREFTFEEYLMIERNASFKSEYVDGLIFKMPGGSGNHALIASNLIGSLFPRLRGTGCRIVGSDLLVSIEDRSFAAYPDVMIFCGAPRYHDVRSDVLLNPCIIFEVLSPSTQKDDHDRKFKGYQQIASLNDYLLVSQARPRVEHWHRGENGWEGVIVTPESSTVHLTSIGIDLELSEIYEGIDLSV